MNSKLIFTMPLALSLVFLSCDDNEIDSQLTNCTRVDTFISLTQDGEPFVDEDAQLLCGRNQAELDEKIAFAQQEFDEAVAAAIAAREASDPDPIPVPMNVTTITFDNPDVDVLANSFSFGDIASINVVENPVAGGTNPEVSNVFEAVVDTSLGNGFNGFGFGVEASGLEILDFTADAKSITVSVYSEVAFTLQAQIGNGQDENGIDIITPRPANTTAVHGGSGWEDLVFDFSISPLFNPFSNNPDAPAGGTEIPAEEIGEITGTYNAIQFQFNGAPADAMTTFYLDNINYVSTSDVVIVEPVEPSDMVTFDEPDGLVLANSFSFGDISSINVVANPVVGGTNPDVTNVFEAVVDTALGNGFNGFGFDVEASGLEVLDFTGDNKLITVSVFSEVAFTLQVQIGNGRDEAGVDIIEPRSANTTAMHSGNGWEDLVFDFSMSPLFNPFFNNPDAPAGGTEIPAEEIGEITGTYNAIQFQFNGAPADAMTTFYLDNIIYN